MFAASVFIAMVKFFFCIYHLTCRKKEQKKEKKEPFFSGNSSHSILCETEELQVTDKTSHFVASWYRPPGSTSEEFKLFREQLD